MKQLVYLFAFCFSCSVSMAQIVLVKDIYNGASPNNANPNFKTVSQNNIFFTAATAAEGTELWKSDGTDAGTVLVKDMLPGAASGVPGAMADFNGLLYFNATTAATGSELYKTDGTSAGTVLVKDINPGAANASPGGSGFVMANSVLYFSATDGTNGDELWKTDGTTAGTVLVKDINPGASGSSIERMTNVNGTLYFWAFTTAAGIELWKSDGTAAGTVMVKDINAGAANGRGVSGSSTLTAIGNTIYFRANDGTHGDELWKSDGTAGGTIMVKDIKLSGGAASHSSPDEFIALNSKIYFAADDDNSRELWVSDGTAAGTAILKKINTACAFCSSSPTQLTLAGNVFFLQAATNAEGQELWKSDGTTAGTVLVKDINPGASGSTPIRFCNVNGTVFFNANNGSTGKELWKSDGTAAGTVIVQDLIAGDSDPFNIILLNQTLLFTSTNLANGRELFKLDVAAILPLHFISFTAQKNDNSIVLNWRTENEQNVLHFEIERSFDGTTFNSIAVVPAKNQLANSYTATDDIAALQPVQQMYYRIKEVDRDNKYSYTGVQRVKLTVKETISVYPNPAKDVINIVGWEKLQQMQLFDVKGKKLAEWQTAQPSIPVHNLTNGIYILKAQLKTGGIAAQKIVVQQ